MKKAKFSTMVTNILTSLLVIVIVSTAPLKEPKLYQNTTLVYKRAQSLDNGINISWLERTWDKGILDKNAIKASDFRLLKQLGIKCIRLPVAFEHFKTDAANLQKVFAYLDETLKLGELYGFKVIICYHFGALDDNNYETETQNAISIWQTITARYLRKSAAMLFYDIYNEPPHMNPDIWKTAAGEIVSAIRKLDPNRTLLVGASNFNSIYELSRMTPLADQNIIYTFHFYEPFFFTHQGAEWVGDQVATTGVPFPYNAENFPQLNPKAKNTWGETNYYQYRTDGNEQSVRDKLQIVKNWSVKYNVPVLCGEYGVYNKYADLDSRCRYIKAVRQNLKIMSIPSILWDYNTNFSVFDGEPSIAHLPECMKDAIGYTGKM